MADDGRKKTKGRQRIEMKKIEKADEKLTTSSKHRSDVYNKVSELVTLISTQHLYSTTGNPFTFFDPLVESIANRFHDRQGELSDTPTHRSSPINGNQQKKHNEVFKVEKDERVEKGLVGCPY
ncbi:AGAMOUS-like 64 [Euphorbia peplus]|nr:AGAMOUS-like 64 [Euphorbia peplus]